MGPRRNYLSLVSLVGVVLLFVPGIHRAIAVGLMLAPWPLLALLRRLAPPAPLEVVVIDDQEVRRQVQGRATERVAWAELVRVDVVTTSAGPFAEDLFFVLSGTTGGSCTLSNAQAAGLLPRLQRLPRFDNEQMILASGSTAPARFVCWTGSPGEGLVAASPPLPPPVEPTS